MYGSMLAERSEPDRKLPGYAEGDRMLSFLQEVHDELDDVLRVSGKQIIVRRTLRIFQSLSAVWRVADDKLNSFVEKR